MLQCAARSRRNAPLAPADMPRERIDFDVVVVGAGPAGLGAACRLGQLARAAGRELNVAVVEKGSAVGAHIVSGALFEPRVLEELFPDWRERGAPVTTRVLTERIDWLTSARRRVRVPHFLVPVTLRNRGNYIVSLGALCEWLASQAEALGINVLAGIAAHRLGEAVHTLGWPLDAQTDGGGFIYHAADARVYLSFIVSLGYRNPHLDPFEEFQRFKSHHAIRELLAGGERISYGARAVNKGGFSSLPKLTFPGGLLAGCDAGFLNPAKIKGSHTALKSGMLAAEAVFAALGVDGAAADAELDRYAERIRASWLWEELYRGRNFSAGLARLGTLGGGALALLEQNLLRGRSPWTLRNRTEDHARLRDAAHARRLTYAKPDEPAQRYCPAGVYEIATGADGAARLQINATNCVHCKTCDIKDPSSNVTWLPPEGGGGPHYSGM